MRPKIMGAFLDTSGAILLSGLSLCEFKLAAKKVGLTRMIIRGKEGRRGRKLFWLRSEIEANSEQLFAATKRGRRQGIPQPKKFDANLGDLDV